uniref:D-glutamate cyclase n=1 Tax=Cyprinus carpio carpio TaxID=630221 RepID=A0A8C0YHT7_CYPCA
MGLLKCGTNFLCRAVRLKCLKYSTRAKMKPGYQQANVVILHKDLADDFEAFCRANSSPLPLLYKSKCGEWSCGPLATGSDIREDCPEYCVFENGVLAKKVASLSSYTPQLQDMVTFYLGCSFGFESALKAAGVPVRNVEQGKNVSMYKTSVACIRAGQFHCPMVVSMRPVPEEKLDAAAQSTHVIPLAHGGPIHIGDPKPVLAFTHSPGCMFITDQKAETISPLTLEPAHCPLTFCISQNPQHYSIASKRAVQQIRAIEELVVEDPDSRGIRALFLQDELLKACLSLSHSSSVLITTGFPTHYMHNPPEETDGPPGAIAMAAMLQALRKEVVIVTDERALEMNQHIMRDAVEKGVIKTAVPVISFQSNGPDSALQFLCHDGDPSKPRFDHLVAIERSGRATDGNYYNMRGVNIKHLVDPIDDLFTTASTIAGITTTGIGDGGNELGMGKVKAAVKAYMPNGNLIACDVAADFAITAGVSNWGGYAVACALYILNLCPIHWRYLHSGLGLSLTPDQQSLRMACLPTVAKEEEMLHILVKYGVRSGKTANLGLEVDGLTFHPYHSDIIQRLRNLTLA